MTKAISEKTRVKYSDLYENYEDDYVYTTRYFDLDRKNFCCDEMYQVLLGEKDGRCELSFGYIPTFREYFIEVKAEFGGAVHLIKFCP